MNRNIHASKQRYRIWLLLLAVVLIIFIIWQWPVINSNISKNKQALGDYLAEIDALGEKSRALRAAVIATKAATEDRLNQLEAQLIESQNLQSAIDTLISRKTISDDLELDVVEEVEQLITFANQHLNTIGNIEAALANLKSAEILLQQMDNSRFLSLHSSVIKDIKNLTAVSGVNNATMETSMRLNNLATAVDTLPLPMDTDLVPVEIDLVLQQTPVENRLWFKFLNEIWADLKSFIHVQKITDPETQLLSPSQTYFLRENLKLKFILMRLSLLSRNKADFDADLKATINWINQYFDQNSAPVTTMLHALGQIQEESIKFETPNISASLDALHNFRNKRKEENK